MASASRRADTRVRVSADGVDGDEAMKGLPRMRRLSALRYPVPSAGDVPGEDARRQGSRDRKLMVEQSTRRTSMAGRMPAEGVTFRPRNGP
ncbi:hypothetical protein GCM10022384_21770 [Streptomyces marokkonensis]|uniref:Uncharacterized protein n=1 Tax=Streptomyces marokkonensis TaxID=324855 RepID=A0ABP7PSQ1_9ACTN